MSSSRENRLSRKRKHEDGVLVHSGTSLHDVTDDFEDTSTIFRVPKRPKNAKTSDPARSRGRTKATSASSQIKKDAAASQKERRGTELCPDDDDDEFTDAPSVPLVTLESQTLEPEAEEEFEKDNFLLELEQSVCLESEKLCPCCKHIVSTSVFGDHFKGCLGKFKLSKRETRSSIQNRSTTATEEETGREEKKADVQVFTCPVCLKVLKSKSQRQAHVKSCAHSHGLSTEQLLLASKLHDKQAEERNLLGLPAGIPDAKDEVKSKNQELESSDSSSSAKGKRNQTSKRVNEKKDPDLAIALALSRSLAEEEAEKRSSREERLLALGLDNIVEEDRKSAPVVFPLSQQSNQKVKENQNKVRGKKRRGNMNTILTRRSNEERERIISEKVAAILASEDAPDIGSQDESCKGGKGRLAKFRDQDCSLWEAAHSHADQPLKDFYVPELEPYIQPKKVAVGGLLKRLSQIPGRLNITQHVLDEDSTSDSEGEAAVVEEYCTQLALVDLLGSQDSLDITVALNVSNHAVDLSSVQELEDENLGPDVNAEAASGFWRQQPSQGAKAQAENTPVLNIDKDGDQQNILKDSSSLRSNIENASSNTVAITDLVNQDTFGNKGKPKDMLTDGDDEVTVTGNDNGKQTLDEDLVTVTSDESDSTLSFSEYVRERGNEDDTGKGSSCSEVCGTKKPDEPQVDLHESQIDMQVIMRNAPGNDKGKKHGVADVSTTVELQSGKDNRPSEGEEDVATTMQCNENTNENEKEVQSHYRSINEIECEIQHLSADDTLRHTSGEEASTEKQHNPRICSLEDGGVKAVAHCELSTSTSLHEEQQNSDEHDRNSNMSWSSDESDKTHVFTEDRGGMNAYRKSLENLLENETVIFEDTAGHQHGNGSMGDKDLMSHNVLGEIESKIPDPVKNLPSGINRNSVSTHKEQRLDADQMTVIFESISSPKNIEEESQKTVTKLNHPKHRAETLEQKSAGVVSSMQNKLMYDWSALLASGEGSDVTINVSDDDSINVHSLVLIARCRPLYDKIEATSKSIRWPIVSYEGAFTFMAYLYTGVCEIRTKDDPLWMELLDLALEYNCDDLVSYLESLYKEAPTTATAAEFSIPKPVISESGKDKIAHTISLVTPKRSDDVDKAKTVRRCLKMNSVCEVAASTPLDILQRDLPPFGNCSGNLSPKIHENSPIRKDPEASLIRKDLRNPEASSIREDPEASLIREDLRGDPEAHPVREDPVTSPIREDPEASPLRENPETSPIGEDPEATPIRKDPEATPIRILNESLSQSPDLFDESEVTHNVSYISPAEKSPPVLSTPNKSHWTKGVQELTEKSNHLSALKGGEDLQQKFDHLMKTSDGKGDRREDVMPSNPNTLMGINNSVVSKSKDMTEDYTRKAFNSEASTDYTNVDTNNSNVEEVHCEDDVIDLTQSSPENACTSPGTLEAVGNRRNSTEMDTEEDMEPLQLMETDPENSLENIVDSNNVKETNNDPDCRKSPIEDIPGDPSPHKLENINDRSYISKVWEDYDDGCSMSMPVDIQYISPTKSISRSEMEVTSIKQKLPKKKNSSEKTALTSPPAVNSSNTVPVNHASTSTQKEKTCIDSNSSLGNDTIAKITAEFDNSSIWAEEFEPAFEKSVSPKTKGQGKVNKPINDLKTPNAKTSTRRSPVTPMPDYNKMDSPELKKSLNQYGIRPIGRRKAVILLQHVYEQTHPLVTDSEADSSYCETPQQQKIAQQRGPARKVSLHKTVLPGKKTSTKSDSKTPKKKTLTKKKQKPSSTAASTEGSDEEKDDDVLNSSQTSNLSSDGSEFDCIEESMMLGIGDDDKDVSPTRQADLTSQVGTYITSDPELHQKILLYEPIFVEDLHASLKANGVKCNMKNLIEVLDEQCITFRTQQNRRTRARTRRSPKKKKGNSPNKSSKSAR